MRPARRSLVAAALLLAGCNLLAGIDDPRHQPACGDGVIGAGEACDDGNAASGDGCSEACQIEPGFSCTGQPSACVGACGDGVVTRGEACDDGNAVSGDGCAGDCAVEPGFSCSGAPSRCLPLCGDGALEAGEPCDDGNLVGGDGCAGDCTIEPGFTCSGAPSRCAPVCGDGRVVGGEACDDGNLVGGDGCSALCQVEHGYACGGLPSKCASVCGDGVVAADEACDDGNLGGEDGCDPSCHVEPGYRCAGEPSVCHALCGDGVLDPGEQCDDGNAAAGDCCSPTCQIEPGCLSEVEPNDSAAQADARAADPAPVELVTSGKIRGSVSPIGDFDYFAVQLPASGVVRIETFDGSGSDCVGIDTQLGLVAAFPVTYVDDDGGVGLCSALVMNLAAGSYYLRVNQKGNSATIPAYLLELASQSSAGAEVEPNETPATATAFGGADAYIDGTHPAATDADYYAVDVPPGGGSIRAEILEGPTSDCATMLTELTLYDAANAMLVNAVGGGRGGCSRLDGTGSAPRDPDAHALAPGKYYLRVRSASGALTSQAVFDYRLSLRIR